MGFKARRATAKRFLLPILVVGAFAAFVVGAQAHPGDLDQSYGNGGLSTIDVEGGHDDFATSMLMDEANRAMLGGYTENTTEDMAVARFKLDGTPDKSAFSNGGVDSASLRIDLGGNDRANGMAMGGDKKLLLAGQTDVNGNEDFAVVRRNIPGGAPDTTFNAGGTPGQLIVDLCGNGGNDIANTVFRLPDGKFLVGGTTDCNGNLDFAIARITAKGVLDPRFTYTGAPGLGYSSPQPGVILVDFGGNDVLTGIWGFSNTKWFASGYTDVNGSNDIAFVGFQGVSRVQPGFGGQGTGRGIFNLGGDDRALAVQVDNNKKIIVGGSSGGHMLVARFKPNAKSLDLSFGSNGVEVGDFGGTDAANALLYQRRLDRKIVPAGSTDASGNNDFGVERLLKDGARDTQFGADGQVTTNFDGTSDDVATGLGFNSVNGKVTVGGYTNANGDYDFAVATYLPT
ncbi:MAG: hypothetical protein ACM3QU_06020 [Verrucomicrobiota bacterium]